MAFNRNELLMLIICVAHKRDDYIKCADNSRKVSDNEELTEYWDNQAALCQSIEDKLTTIYHESFES